MMSNLEKAGRLVRLMGWLYLVVVIVIATATLIPFISEGGNSQDIILHVVLSFVALLIPILFLTTGSAIKVGRKW